MDWLNSLLGGHLRLSFPMGDCLMGDTMDLASLGRWCPSSPLSLLTSLLFDETSMDNLGERQRIGIGVTRETNRGTGCCMI